MTRSYLNAVLLFALLMVAPLPFLPEFGGANSSTRLMLSDALVVDGTTRIDRYAELTRDKAQIGDAYYSDKAPGMALLAVPAYAAARAVAPEAARQLVRFDTPLDDLPRGTMIAWRMISWTSGGLLMALAGVAMFRMGQRLGGSARASFLASVSVCLATPVLGWSVPLFGHVGAGAALMIGFALSTGLGRSDVWLPAPARVILAAAALSVAVSIEYTAAPPALVIGLYAIWRLTHIKGRAAWGLFALAVASALIAALPMLMYHWISFGSPFRVGYSSVVGFEGMEEGFLGLTFPDPVVLMKILFGMRKGILWLSPLLVLVPFGVWIWSRRPKTPFVPLGPEMALCLFMIVYYFLLNASYFYWGGGLSIGPRHTIPSVFFMVLPFLVLWQLWDGLVLRALFALSVFFSFAGGVVGMAIPSGRPLTILDSILKNLITDQNAFLRMANWDLSPALVFGVWLGLVAGLAWRALPART